MSLTTIYEFRKTAAPVEIMPVSAVAENDAFSVQKNLTPTFAPGIVMPFMVGTGQEIANPFSLTIQVLAGSFEEAYQKCIDIHDFASDSDQLARRNGQGEITTYRNLKGNGESVLNFTPQLVARGGGYWRFQMQIAPISSRWVFTGKLIPLYPAFYPSSDTYPGPGGDST